MVKFGIQSRMVLLVAASFVAGTSSAAMAADPKAPETPAANASSSASQPKTAQRYCIVTTLTGSHLPTKICKTRAEWLEDGVDPLAKD